MNFSDQIKVLLVDDDEEDYIITRDILSEISNRKYKLDWVSNLIDAEKAISRKEHHVYLIDYRLGPDDGLELIRLSVDKGMDAPMILLTGQGDLAIDELAMQAGAADYLVKGTIVPYQLERSIRYSINDYNLIREIKQLNQDLEQRVEERTHELEEAIVKLDESRNELVEALEKEKELNEMKSRFVTMASHEFRTPLSTILSSTSLLDKYTDQDIDKRKKHIGRIKASVKNLVEILESFLSLSKLEEGRIETNPVYFDLDKFAEELVEDISTIAIEGQQIVFTYEGDNNIFLDKQILHNVLINLISNAIKYSPANKNIYFETRVDTDEIIFEVRDEGIGIPEEEQKHLFERFFRARNAINVQGTGLGLHIVKKYVDLLGGEITFKSSTETGTVFKINIPRI